MKSKIITKFYTELAKYEQEGVDSMAWAEWAAASIDEDLVQHFELADWQVIQDTYLTQSDNMKALIINHIRLNNIEIAELQLTILTQILYDQNEGLAYEALQPIVFGLVTSGRDKSTGELFCRKELKGIFLTKKGFGLIQQFLTNQTIEKIVAIAKGCGTFQKEQILKAVEVINEIK